MLSASHFLALQEYWCWTNPQQVRLLRLLLLLLLRCQCPVLPLSPMHHMIFPRAHCSCTNCALPAGLDVTARQEVWRIIQAERTGAWRAGGLNSVQSSMLGMLGMKRRPPGILLCTHSMVEADVLSDRIAVMNAVGI